MDPGEGGSPAAPSTSAVTPGVGMETKEDAEKQVLQILVNAPGSGKSMFAEDIMASVAAGRPWARVCQDTIGKGKAGTKIQCLKAAADALKEGKSVLIDRCNLEREQHSDFVKLGCTVQADVHAIFLDLPANVCISRSVSRTSHEGNVQDGMATMVVNRMLKNKQTPFLLKVSVGSMLTDDDDIKKAVDMYSALGPSHSLALGVFGQKSKGPVQAGIMKFLKKVDTSKVDKSSGTMLTSSERKTEQQNTTLKQENLEASGASSMQVEKKLDNLLEKEEQCKESVSSDIGLCTLAFPSISTTDFQLDLEKASDVIVDATTDFMQKHDNVRLVLVDLSLKSRILSLVKNKASKKSFDSSRFFTFVGDITQLHSKEVFNAT
ncbi:hypothetical protein ZWY2020_005921 [Hordeum vulgare]|nr:hypothetical protein ZWY2020_005921 [Hordeum vulgare]